MYYPVPTIENFWTEIYMYFWILADLGFFF